MPVPINFRRSAEGAIASYTWSDIAAGTGYVAFYCFDDEDNKAMCTSRIDSSIGYTKATWAAGSESAAMRAELDFDAVFNLPQRIKGKLYVSLTYRLTTTGAGTPTNSVYTKVRIYHVDTSAVPVETEIGTQQETKTITRTDSIGTSSGRTTIKFDVNRHFKKNEKIRVNVELWGSGTADCWVYLYHDGANRNWSLVDSDAFAINTDLPAYVPFKIDL